MWYKHVHPRLIVGSISSLPVGYQVLLATITSQTHVQHALSFYSTSRDKTELSNLAYYQCTRRYHVKLIIAVSPQRSNQLQVFIINHQLRK